MKSAIDLKANFRESRPRRMLFSLPLRLWTRRPQPHPCETPYFVAARAEDAAVVSLVRAEGIVLSWSSEDHAYRHSVMHRTSSNLTRELGGVGDVTNERMKTILG
jgi:hypothetical protein